MISIPFKKMDEEHDLSVYAIRKAIKMLAEKQEIKRITVVVPHEEDFTYITNEGEVIHGCAIQFVISDVLKQYAWIVFSPDTNDVFVSEGA